MDHSLTPQPPSKEDVLFRGDLLDWQNNACLNVKVSRGDGIAYMEGYRRGALKLVEHVVDNHRDQDFLVYPIIFLYRHHIELVLKRIIERAPYLLDRDLSQAEQKHLESSHRLNVLWQDLKPMFIAICEAVGWGRPDAKDISGIDSYIRQLCELDPDSMRFRYNSLKNGDPSLPPELKGINLRHFAEMMERLATYFEGIDLATADIEETKAEMEAEFASEAAQYMDYGYEDYEYEG